MPDLRASPRPPLGSLLLARPAAGPPAPAVLVSTAERWDGGRPLPYRAAPHRRRLGVALYLGDRRWAPAVLPSRELAEVSAALAAWPAWAAALRATASALVEAALLSAARPEIVEELARAVAAAQPAVAAAPWWGRKRALTHVGGGSDIYPGRV